MKGDGECKLLNHQPCHVEYHISVRRGLSSVLRYTGKQYISLHRVWHFTQLCVTPFGINLCGCSQYQFLARKDTKGFFMFCWCVAQVLCVLMNSATVITGTCPHMNLLKLRH